MKIMGIGGSMHPDRRSGQDLGKEGKCDEWTVGTNKPNVDHVNAQCKTGSMHGFSVPSGTPREAMVVGKQLPSLLRPSDNANANCRTNRQYGSSGSEFNSNRPWKGIAKLMSSWSADDISIPSIFGKTLTDRIHALHWEDFTPSSGKAKDQTNSMRALAEKGCESIKPFPKRFDGCVFDFMSQGKKAATTNLKMTQGDVAVDPTKPTVKSVRDSSGGGNPAEWVGHPEWGCVDEFSLHVTDKAKKHMKAKHMKSQKDGMCKCQHKYLGICAYDHFICIADINLEAELVATTTDWEQYGPLPKTKKQSDQSPIGSTIARGSKWSTPQKKTAGEKAYCRCVSNDDTKGISIRNTGCGNP